MSHYPPLHKGRPPTSHQQPTRGDRTNGTATVPTLYEFPFPSNVPLDFKQSSLLPEVVITER